MTLTGGRRDDDHTPAVEEQAAQGRSEQVQVEPGLVIVVIVLLVLTGRFVGQCWDELTPEGRGWDEQRSESLKDW